MKPHMQMGSIWIIGLFFFFSAPFVSRADDFYVPDSLVFCGETVPLTDFYTRERLEVQLRSHSDNPGQIILWAKRRARFFPTIQELLKESKLPADLIYVPVIESGLQYTARSVSEAVGPWQFIYSTAQNHDLRVDDQIDERLDIEKSTRAAIIYLKRLYTEFGSWPTALAAYNIGENRIRSEIYRQGTVDYFRMMLPNETDRYVFNVMAAKLFLEQPEKYGIDLSTISHFGDIPSKPVSKQIKSATPVSVLAYCATISYREFRMLNPWCIGTEIPSGQYTFRVPEQEGDHFKSKLDDYMRLTGDTVKLPKSMKVKVKADMGEMRLGPSEQYPSFRSLPNNETFVVKYRTAQKDRNHYWYLFQQKNGANGWIWGGVLHID